MTPKTHGRLAIFLPGSYDGGAERTMVNLAEGLAGRGYAVDLVLAEAAGPYLAEVPSSVRLVVLNARQLRSSRTLACLPAFVRYLRRERPEALLSTLNYANIVALWARRLAGIPWRMVINEQNTVSAEIEGLPAWRRWLLPGLLKSFYPWADSVVAVSTGVADDLARVAGLERERVQVIYNPVVTPKVRRRAQEPLEHAWFAAGQPPVVLAVGRLTAQKDFPTLIRAFAQVRETSSMRLMILGDGDDRPALEALVRRLRLEQDVSLPGFVANPYAYMARSSLFVLSSRWEGLPTVLIEALYCGIPVVATDCPSGPRENPAGGAIRPIGADGRRSRHGTSHGEVPGCRSAATSSRELVAFRP